LVQESSLSRIFVHVTGPVAGCGADVCVTTEAEAEGVTTAAGGEITTTGGDTATADGETMAAGRAEMGAAADRGDGVRKSLTTRLWTDKANLSDAKRDFAIPD
jgi:hypothetical protein